MSSGCFPVPPSAYISDDLDAAADEQQRNPWDAKDPPHSCSAFVYWYRCWIIEVLLFTRDIFFGELLFE